MSLDEVVISVMGCFCMKKIIDINGVKYVIITNLAQGYIGIYIIFSLVF